MIRSRILVVTLLLTTLTACRTGTVARGVDLTPTATLTDTPEPSPTPEPTLTLVPTVTSTPTRTPFPTANEVAPERTFTEVGDVALLSGIHGVSGKAVVAGLQTLIIQGFYYDGKGGRLDIRLVKGEDWQHPVAVLAELEERVYEKEMLHMIIPSSAGPGSADRIVVYAPSKGEVYAWATFE